MKHVIRKRWKTFLLAIVKFFVCDDYLLITKRGDDINFSYSMKDADILRYTYFLHEYTKAGKEVDKLKDLLK